MHMYILGLKFFYSYLFLSFDHFHCIFLLIYKYSLHVKDITFNSFIEIKLKYLPFAHLNYTIQRLIQDMEAA